DRLSVAGEATGLEETLAAAAAENGHDVEPADGGADGGDTDTRSVGHPLHGDSSVEAIVLSGDSTASAVVTFELTSRSKLSKRCSSAGDTGGGGGGVAAASELAEFPVGANGSSRRSGQ
ncbi:unnamed protein product, partial [Ectocarpus fasciculatus]